MAGTVDIFEILHGLNQTEATIVVEAMKAVMVTIGAAFSIVIFTTLAKRREQDSALFNEIVKGRIVTVHALNKEIAFLFCDYLEQLKSVCEFYERSPQYFTNSRRRHVVVKLTMLMSSFDVLDLKIGRVKASIRRARYEIGEQSFASMSARLDEFRKRINFLVKHYDECCSKWGADMARVVLDIEDAKLVIAEVVTCVGAHEIQGMLSRMHEGFEQVIRRKGHSRRFAIPVDIDDATGMFRIHPVAEEIRHRLARLTLTPPPKG